MAKQPLTITPPGPGPWELDPVHFPRPVTAYWAEMHPEPFAAGFGDFMAFYGIPLEKRLTSYPGGFCYSQMVPVAPEEFPDRVARSAEVFEQKGWREQAKEWEEVRKPAAIEAHLAIQAVDPEQLSNDELIAHLRRCREHHALMIRQHMAFTGTAVIPAGDFLVHTQAWTGLPTVKLLGLMRGASLVSGGGSEQHAALVAAFRADPAARKALDIDDEDDPGEVLQTLRDEDTAAGRALNDYLDLVGYRLLDGFDISGRYALEMPDVLLRSIITAIDSDGVESDLEAQVAEVRSHVPEEHRDAWDSLLAEARIGYAVRDERGVFSDIWASGLMRRAAMAAGRRLRGRGRLHDAEHFVFANIDEMCKALEGSPTPTPHDLAARLEYHQTYTAKDVPAHIGDDPVPPPDPSQLPPPMQRLMAAVGIAMSEMFGQSVEEHEGEVIKGLAASAGICEGTVRRVNGPVDFNRIQKGDILLTEATTEAFNILLPLLAAIITDSGGALSHAALVSREYGIPGVVGTRDATERISDGARVRVDGDKGEVTVLG